MHGAPGHQLPPSLHGARDGHSRGLNGTTPLHTQRRDLPPRLTPVSCSATCAQGKETDAKVYGNSRYAPTVLTSDFLGPPHSPPRSPLSPRTARCCCHCSPTFSPPPTRPQTLLLLPGRGQLVHLILRTVQEGGKNQPLSGWLSSEGSTTDNLESKSMLFHVKRQGVRRNVSPGWIERHSRAENRLDSSEMAETVPWM